MQNKIIDEMKNIGEKYSIDTRNSLLVFLNYFGIIIFSYQILFKAKIKLLVKSNTQKHKYNRLLKS